MNARLGVRIFAGLAACAVLSAIAVPAAAEAPDVNTIVTRMKQALEPPRAVAAQLKFTVGEDQQKTTVTLGMARAKHGTANRLLLVGLEPQDLRGTAYLIEDGSPDTAPQWVYLPFIRRVRKVVTQEAFRAFLNSDFTYSDLGFVDLQAAYTLLGTETVNGGQAYRIESVPKRQWYYGKIVTLVDGKTFLPIDREYYDLNGLLWKKEHWNHITVIDGIPTPAQISMRDVQANTTSSISFSELRYDANVPTSLIEPSALPQAADSPLWTTLGMKAPAK
jgi:outer membrane lipoprotein-sorting protein